MTFRCWRHPQPWSVGQALLPSPQLRVVCCLPSSLACNTFSDLVLFLESSISLTSTEPALSEILGNHLLGDCSSPALREEVDLPSPFFPGHSGPVELLVLKLPWPRWLPGLRSSCGNAGCGAPKATRSSLPRGAPGAGSAAGPWEPPKQPPRTISVGALLTRKELDLCEPVK